jgi:hypothetical protein
MRLCWQRMHAATQVALIIALAVAFIATLVAHAAAANRAAASRRTNAMIGLFEQLAGIAAAAMSAANDGHGFKVTQEVSFDRDRDCDCDCD